MRVVGTRLLRITDGLQMLPRGVRYSQMLTELVYSPDILCGEKSVGESPGRGIRAPCTPSRSQQAA